MQSDSGHPLFTIDWKQAPAVGCSGQGVPEHSCLLAKGTHCSFSTLLIGSSRQFHILATLSNCKKKTLLPYHPAPSATTLGPPGKQQ